MRMRKVIGEKRRAIQAALSALRPRPVPPPAAPEGDGPKTRKLVRKVTFETERTYIFRSRGGTAAAWCAACGAEVEMASVETAARAAGVGEMAVYQLVESGALHFTETADGRVLVCLNSLRQ